MSPLFLLLVALVALAPLPIASVFPWSWALMASWVGLMLIFWGGQIAIGKRGAAVYPHHVWWILAPFFLAILWAFLQMASFMPSAWHHPFWTTSAATLGNVVTGSISINPQQTLEGIVRLLAYGGVFWLALQFGRNERRAHFAFYTIAIVAGLYAAYGIAVEITNDRMILWYEKKTYLWSLTSTFVVRNHFAAYAGLGLLCTTALLWQKARTAISGVRHPKERRRLLLEYFAGRSWPLLAAWFLLAVALLLTQSRGGFLVTILGLMTFFLAIALGHAAPRRWVAGLAMATIATGYLFFLLSGEAVGDRLEQTNLAQEDRLRVYERTVAAIQDSPLLGTGLGTFKEVFRFYQTEDIGGIFHQAHNTYLENALELGIPAASLLTLSVAGGMLLCGFGVVRRRRNTTYPAIGLAASVLVGVHSLFDFPLQIPAVAATYAFILGIACAQSWSSQAHTERP